MHQYFRDNPESIEHTFRGIGFDSFPDITSSIEISGDVTVLEPTERRADSVLRMTTKAGDRFIMIFEAQRERSEEKRARWPQYLTNLYDRHKEPVVLVVVCHDRATAAWAEKPISLGPDFWATCVVNPLVLGPHNVPAPTGPISEEDLPLAVFGVITRGKDPEVAGILGGVAEALQKTDEKTRENFVLYIQLALTDPFVAEEWKNMMSLEVETVRSNPVLGKMLEQAETEAEARTEAGAVFTVLDERGIVLTDAHRERILAITDLKQLTRMLRAAMHVDSAEELFA